MPGHAGPRQTTSSPAATTASAPTRTAQRQGTPAIVTCPARFAAETPGAPPPAPPGPPASPPVTEPAEELVPPAPAAAASTAAVPRCRLTVTAAPAPNTASSPPTTRRARPRVGRPEE